MSDESIFCLVEDSFCVATNPSRDLYPTTVTIYVDGGCEVALVFPDEQSMGKVHHMLGFLLDRDD